MLRVKQILNPQVNIPDPPINLMPDSREEGTKRLPNLFQNTTHVLTPFSPFAIRYFLNETLSQKTFQVNKKRLFIVFLII